jgi:hypothetical protein
MTLSTAFLFVPLVVYAIIFFIIHATFVRVKFKRKPYDEGFHNRILEGVAFCEFCGGDTWGGMVYGFTPMCRACVDLGLDHDTKVKSMTGLLDTLVEMEASPLVVEAAREALFVLEAKAPPTPWRKIRT